MIKNIIFDLGRVLIDFYPRECLKRLGYNKEEVDILERIIFRDYIWEEGDLGVRDTIEEALPFYISKYPEHESLIKDFISRPWKENLYLPINRILFDTARDLGYKIYLLTNFAADGFAYIERAHDFIRMADGRVVSAHIKVTKPNAKIYNELLNKYQLEASECVFFDDSLPNIEGAKKAGIRSYQFSDVNAALDIIKHLND